MLLTNYPGVSGFEHFLYMIICLILMAISIVFINKIKNDDKKIKTIMRVIGFVLLIVIICNRVSVTYNNVVIEKREGVTWLSLIPNTVCGFASFVYSFSLIFAKKDSKIFHFICYLGFLGGVLTFIYPDFLDNQTFFDPRTITGLVHHTIMFCTTIICIITGYLKPSFKKVNYYIIGLAFLMVFGLFEIDVLHFSKAMMIGAPLVSSLPILSSWYVIGPVSIGLLVIFTLTFEYFQKKKGSICKH